MKVLVVGGGGREHALVWKISQSPRVKEIYCAPGNAGIAELANCVDIEVDDLNGLLAFALEKQIDLTIVGPEIPLTLGIVDKFREKGLKIFGPTQKAAEIEKSKAFAKELMAKYNIPTAKYQVFTEVSQAQEYVRELGVPCVVKADGLAAGKGVIICSDIEEADQAIEDILLENRFGQAGNRVVIEEFLEGQEVSILAFTDGQTVVPMVSAQDHKRVFDNDQGPNTGGMGAYSPAPVYSSEIHEFVVKNILEATVKAMQEEGRVYSGVLYAGLMLTSDGPKVLEFNARFGDPETQVVLPRLKTGIILIIEAILNNRLDEINIEWFAESSVCVVLAAGGYPGNYEKGKVIQGLNDTSANIQLFHAGTQMVDGQILTNGGRVLGITAQGENLAAAITKVYAEITKINFEEMHYRKDIGKKGLEACKEGC